LDEYNRSERLLDRENQWLEISMSGPVTVADLRRRRLAKVLKTSCSTKEERAHYLSKREIGEAAVAAPGFSGPTWGTPPRRAALSLVNTSIEGYPPRLSSILPDVAPPAQYTSFGYLGRDPQYQ
jgi:hypothetical protein